MLPAMKSHDELEMMREAFRRPRDWPIRRAVTTWIPPPGTPMPDPIGLYALPREVLTPEFCLEQMVKHKRDIREIPEWARTEEVCWIALKKWPGEIDNIPEHCLTQAMCDYAVENDPSLFRAIPFRFHTEEMYWKVASVYPGMVSSLPAERLTQELRDYIAAQKPDRMHIPFWVIDEERRRAHKA